jgi:hypothetical protein
MARRIDLGAAARAHPDLNIAGAWDLPPKRRTRILLEYRGAWRPLLWVEFAQDGSVYLGPRLTEITVARHGSVPINRQGNTTIDVTRAKDIADRAKVRGGRLSFHASGVVHMGEKRIFRAPLEELRGDSRQNLLCAIVVQHPSTYGAVTDFRKRDIRLPYPIDERRPMFGIVYIAEQGTETVFPQKGATRQADLIFHCNGLSRAPDLALHVVLAHGIEGDWQTHTVVLMPEITEDAPSDQDAPP